MANEIDYGNLMHNAMRSLIQDVLAEVKINGLPGEHHFFITFDTNHPEVEMASWLKERYPTEITVVMQHWYEDLDVRDDGFSVTLNFGDTPEHLVIPYESILTFAKLFTTVRMLHLVPFATPIFVCRSFHDQSYFCTR